MLLKAEPFAKRLQGEIAPLYAVYGDAPLLALEAADDIRAAARKRGFCAREVRTVLPDFDWGQFIAALGAPSLFGNKKIVELRIPTGKPGKGVSILTDYCQRIRQQGAPDPDCLLLVSVLQLDWRDEKSAWFSALLDAGVCCKFTTPALTELPAWIAGRLERQGQHTDQAALTFMAEQVEGNLLAAHQEIQKLALLYPPGALTGTQVRNAVLNVARYHLDDLREAFYARDFGRFARALEGLRQEGEAPQLVLWALTEELRLLIQLQAGLARRQPFNTLCRDLRIRTVRQQALQWAVKTFSRPALYAALMLAARLDRRIKGLDHGGSGDVWEGFLRLGICLRTSGISA
ncbi:MAG: DNA polymerase III subunit delta [Zoogloeaceae bacterium]|jgi:DNA polymerase-3 subunit delta|nr:DNA polymerase III subunit delta [Zoogloeaceae bacterium]